MIFTVNYGFLYLVEIASFTEVNCFMIIIIRRYFLPLVPNECYNSLGIVTFLPVGHMLSKVTASKRGAKKLIADVFEASRLVEDWSALQQRHIVNNHKKV